MADTTVKNPTPVRKLALSTIRKHILTTEYTDLIDNVVWGAETHGTQIDGKYTWNNGSNECRTGGQVIHYLSQWSDGTEQTRIVCAITDWLYQRIVTSADYERIVTTVLSDDSDDSETLIEGWIVAGEIGDQPAHVSAETNETVEAQASIAIDTLKRCNVSDAGHAKAMINIQQQWLIEQAKRCGQRFVYLPFVVCFKGDRARHDAHPSFHNDFAYYMGCVDRTQSAGYAHENKVIMMLVDLQ